MADRKSFYGKPLNLRLLDSEEGRVGGPSYRRAVRENRETVKDDQGRRRFHGAFTGGFSAGYFGSVGTVEGFRPKKFITHRNKRDRCHDEPTFRHCPEDYMDDEDFKEFGIAPKKVRLVDSRPGPFKDASLDDSDDLQSDQSLDLTRVPLGELILRRMCGQNTSWVCDIRHHFEPKNDFRGLGYKGLERHDTSSQVQQTMNPLVCRLKGGKQLKIAGSAFGEGVFDEDDGLFGFDEYGIDDLTNYDFAAGSRKRIKDVTIEPKAEAGRLSLHPDRGHHIRGFQLISLTSLQETCDTDVISDYPLPEVPKDWKIPTRQKPYPIAEYSKSEGPTVGGKSRSYKDFVERFSASTSTLQTNNLATLSGLISYADLKSIELRDSDKSVSPIESQPVEKPTVERRVTTWKPCSLLCKRFNVLNPSTDDI